MGSFLSFTVESFDVAHPGGHRLADFARLDPAIRAAKLAFDDHGVSMAVVRDREGAVVFVADAAGEEWTG